MMLALVGNQNCGKTTLFNALTGARQHVGNFPGITVEQKLGQVKGAPDCTVADLPGIYSLRPYTQEEIVSRNFILSQKPDGIINILDATNIERNLYLSLQLLELQIPMVVALNMMDELRENGGSVDTEELSRALGVPVVLIVAAKGEGLSQLMAQAVSTAKNRTLPAVDDFCGSGSPVYRCIHAVSSLIQKHAAQLGVSARFCASRLIEDDPAMADMLGLEPSEKALLERCIRQMETETGLDRNAALADMRYHFIEGVVAKTVVKCHESREHRRSLQIDRLLTGRYTALPVFLGIMLLIFCLSFHVIGSALSGWLRLGIDAAGTLLDRALRVWGVNPLLHCLVMDGIFVGVGSVLSFLPLIVTLFFFLSLLEDTGYLARVAFVMDKPLRKLGLSGRSIVPLLMGFGCSVPAVMATRTVSSDRDRKMAILLIPYMSCSAKLPIYAVFAAAFFKHSGLAMTALYLTGITTGILAALVLKSTGFRGAPAPFVMELPNYRLPSARSVCLLLWEKARDFLQRAFTIIFMATILVWFLQSFDARLHLVTDSRDSLLSLLGQQIAPLFAPLGFGDWRMVTALLSGCTAKEAVVSTLAVLLETSMAELGSALRLVFTPLTAASFLVFTLLYTPCVAAVATVRRELGSPLKALGLVLLQCGVAWTAAFLVYHLGMLLV